MVKGLTADRIIARPPMVKGETHTGSLVQASLRYTTSLLAILVMAMAVARI